MQIIGSFQIVTFITSVVPTLFSCIALFCICYFCLALLLILLCPLECAWGFRLCGGDHGLCPLDSHKPLKRLDRNFKCLGSLGTIDCGGLLSIFFGKFNAAALIKKLMILCCFRKIHCSAENVKCAAYCKIKSAFSCCFQFVKMCK